MELRNCPECGKLFAFVSRNLCPDCIAFEEECIQKIQEYIDDYGASTIAELSEGTDVPEEMVIYLLREGRLIIRGGVTLLECERCGRPIPSGRYCADCCAALEASLKDVLSANEGKETGEERGNSDSRKKSRMHTAEIYRKPHS